MVCDKQIGNDCLSQIPPVRLREPGVPEVPAHAGPKVSLVTGVKS